MIDAEIETVRSKLNQIRVTRQQQREEMKHYIDQATLVLDNGRNTFHKYRLGKSKELSHYFSIMKTTQSSQSLPNSRTLRIQSTLLYCYHQIHVMQKAMELIEHQKNVMIRYMQCEMVVLEDEMDEVGMKFQDEKNRYRQHWDLVEHPRLHQLRIQENAMGHIRSLLVLQAKRRYHHSSAGPTSKVPKIGMLPVPDLKESCLSHLALQRLDWIQRLPTHDSNSEPICMIQLLKDLLEIDGTFFPPHTDIDKFLDDSMNSNRHKDILSGVSA
jgi:hypothetical protein